MIEWRRYIVSILITGATALVLAWSWPRASFTDMERRAVAEHRTIITYWDRHSGHEHAARRALIDEFNASQDQIFVRTLPIGWNMEKTVTSIAGAAPPDLMSVDSTVLSQLVAQGCFLPLDDLMASVPALGEAAFFPHIWAYVCYDGHVWGVPTTTDSVCLLWNKSAFRKAGLDPEMPPRTMDELGRFAAALNLRENGRLVQMGFLPWAPWDQSHMWGGLFGGEWIEPGTGRICAAESPGIIESFRWQGSFTRDPALPADSPLQAAYAMDIEEVATFRSGFGSYQSASNPFYTGRVAMIADGEWQVTFIGKYAPGLDWGVAPLPQPEGVTPRCYSPSCIVDAIPATAKHKEAAKAYLRWFNTPRPDGRPSPSSDYCFAIHNIPTRPDEARQSRFMDNPKFRVFVEQIFARENIPAPILPVTQFLMDEMERQRERVTFHRASAEDAVRAVAERVNEELRSVQRHMQEESGS